MVKLYTPDGIYEYVCPNCGEKKVEEQRTAVASWKSDTIVENDSSTEPEDPEYTVDHDEDAPSRFSCPACSIWIDAESWEDLAELIKEEGKKTDD